MIKPIQYDNRTHEKLVLALPKGRILDEVMPLLSHVGIKPEPAFEDTHSRQLRFSTNINDLDIIRVRSFDVATFVAFGAAHLGVAGNDVLMEFNFPEIYAPIDLGIGQCHISIAEPACSKLHDDPSTWSSVRVATKYPEITRNYFSQKGVQAECIKLNGAIELAPSLGLCRHIVDLVSTGNTLIANGLVEVDVIAEITSRLAVNRVSWKTRATEINYWIKCFRESVRAIGKSN